jgi:pilus assembly protein CpaD
MSHSSFIVKLKATALTFGFLLPLCGCGTTDRIVPVSSTPDDYHARHPILIAEAKSVLDVFPSQGHRLDSHTRKQILAFAEQYHDLGHGPVLILLPRGPHGRDDQAFIGDIRATLASGGANGGVEVSSYPVGDPRLAAPVRLSFKGIKAKVADQCGQWPSDLGSGSSVDGWENKTYWNFGCATQQMIAAQTSDPRDLVTPRGEEPADTQIRARGITSIRGGTDPATAWTVKNSSIGSVGGS